MLIIIEHREVTPSGLWRVRLLLAHSLLVLKAYAISNDSYPYRYVLTSFASGKVFLANADINMPRYRRKLPFLHLTLFHAKELSIWNMPQVRFFFALSVPSHYSKTGKGTFKCKKSNWQSMYSTVNPYPAARFFYYRPEICQHWANMDRTWFTYFTLRLNVNVLVSVN